jgi:hypothetical protein
MTKHKVAVPLILSSILGLCCTSVVQSQANPTPLTAELFGASFSGAD